MHTRVYLAILFASLFFISTTSAQNSYWGKLFDTFSGAICSETAVGPEGTVFAFGYYSSELDLGVKTLTPKYDGGSFIIKMTMDGVVVDAFQIDGHGVIIENAKIDHEGNIIVSGRIFGSIEFNGEELGGEYSAYVAKYAADGTPLWIEVIPNGGAYANVAVDAVGNIFFIVTKVHDFYSSSSVLYKYDPQGHLVFEKEFLNESDQMSYVRAIDVHNGEAIIVGMVEGAGTIFNQLSYSGDWWGFYVAKFNADGSLRKVINVGESTYNNADCNDIVFTADGGFVLAGGLPDNALLVRYDSDMKKLWTKKSLPQRFSAGYVALNNSGEIFLAITFYAGAEVDGIEFEATPDSHWIANAPNFALIKMDHEGKMLWARQAKPGIINDVESIAIGHFGEIYLGGWTNTNPLEIGSLTLQSSKDDGYNSADGFVIRFDDGPADHTGFAIITNEICLGATNSFHTDVDPSDIQTILWNFGDPSSGALNTSTQISPSHKYSAAGSYKVLATITTHYGTTAFSSFFLTVHPAISVELGEDILLCTNEQRVLAVSYHDDWTYKWQDGSTTPTFVASQAGKYWVEVASPYCISSDTIQITPADPPVMPELNDEDLCPGQTLLVDLASLNCVISWNDGSNSTTRTFSTAGLYTVTATNSCGSTSRTFKVEVEPSLDLSISNKVLCRDELYAVDLSTIDANVQWNDGHAAKERVLGPGNYLVHVSNRCETKTIAFSLTQAEAPGIDLGPDRVICSSSGRGVTLSLSDTHASMKWSDGSSGNSLYVTRAGTYWAEVSNECESVRDSVEVLEASNLFMPNVITPNGDEKNEYFVLHDQILGTPLLIVDRWGTRVFETNSYQNDWNGDNLETGVYYYVIPQYCLKGWVQILR